MTELLFSSDEDSARGSCPHEEIKSSISGVYQDSELASEALASSAQPSDPVAADRGKPAVPQPDPSATQVPPTASQPETPTSPLTSAASPAETTMPPFGEETATDAPAA